MIDNVLRQLRQKSGPVGWLIALGVLCAIGYFGVEWTINRKYVREGESLLLRYKGPPLPFLPGSKPSASGRFAKVDDEGNPLEVGILEELRGPGRHFYSPFWWELTIVPDVVVEPGQVAIVTSRMGKELPGDQFLVDGDLGETEYKGILRKVFGPGRYRINTYAYDVNIVELETIQTGTQLKYAGWVKIEPGYVGVVTNLTSNPLTGAEPGIENRVRTPGIYPINPNEQHIDVVEIGYREKSIISNVQLDRSGQPVLDPSGEPKLADDDSGISFPSNDGFPIQMDFTAVWGILPEQAPEVIRKFGNVAAVETKVVVPQIESICRNMGSRMGAVNLLIGESRQRFQEDTSESFKLLLHDKGITLLYGLVRHIYIPQEVRLPIQESFVADELKLTREQEQLTARTEATLRAAERTVELETERIRVETQKLVAKAVAEGEKTAQETRAETVKLVAAVDRKTAELDAQAQVVLGEATSGAQQLQEEARADKFTLAVQAFGSGDAYNQWVFASGLPEDIQLNLLYAGQGTFWTDLKGFTETMLGRQAQQSTQGGATVRPAGAGR